MANKSLFGSIKSIFAPANTHNAAGGVAYRLDPKHQLAQIAATGCFHGTFYANGESQLDEVRKLIDQINDNTFLAKLAVYARDQAHMKDMPAALLAVLSKRDPQLLHKVFGRVVDNGRVLRTLFQMVRSGQFGRKGLSSSLQRAFQRWLNEASVGKLLSASIGNDPSLRDILRMARPKPQDNARRALYGWLTEKEIAKWAPATADDLPREVQALAKFRQAASAAVQLELMADLSAVRWDLLADSAQGSAVWKAMAKQMGPQALRMNLNTLLRQGVFGANGNDREFVNYVAGRLADANEVRRSKQFPYQFLAAYLNAGDDVPQAIKTALHQGAEIACGNIPELPGPVLIGLDTSGSMTSPITGNRGRGATSKMRCVDVAALFAAAILRRNPESIVVPFDTQAYEAKLDPNDSILSLSERLAKYGGGGTDCSLPLQTANSRFSKRKFAGVVLVSDNQSWIYQQQAFAAGTQGATGVVTEWNQFVQNQRRLGVISPKLICIDLQPYGNTQAPEREDIMNIGGFSDAVFNVIASFLGDDGNRFVAEVEAVTL